jgi:hypothetical protein
MCRGIPMRHAMRFIGAAQSRNDSFRSLLKNAYPNLQNFLTSRGYLTRSDGASA